MGSIMNVCKSLNSYVVGCGTTYLPWVGLALWPGNSNDYSRGLFRNTGPEGGGPFHPMTATFVATSPISNP